jgi:hypothetical protein
LSEEIKAAGDNRCFSNATSNNFVGGGDNRCFSGRAILLAVLVRFCPFQVGSDEQIRPPAKLLRSLSSIGNVPCNVLTKQLAWIKAHPEVLPPR